MGEKDCSMTSQQCDAVCNKPHAICNVTTKQCTTCDPFTQPNCTQLKGECDEACKNKPDFFTCNVAKGVCEKCEPSKTKSCTPSKQGDCDKECKNKSGFFKCDWVKNQCVAAPDSDPDKTTKEECEKMCHQPTYAKCDFGKNKCVECNIGLDKECINTKESVPRSRPRGSASPPSSTSRACGAGSTSPRASSAASGTWSSPRT